MTMYLSVLQSVSLLAHESGSDQVGANQSVAEQQNVILGNRLHQTAPGCSMYSKSENQLFYVIIDGLRAFK